MTPASGPRALLLIGGGGAGKRSLGQAIGGLMTGRAPAEVAQVQAGWIKG